jgi:hypothetical protein
MFGPLRNVPFVFASQIKDGHVAMITLSGLGFLVYV